MAVFVRRYRGETVNVRDTLAPISIRAPCIAVTAQFDPPLASFLHILLASTGP